MNEFLKKVFASPNGGPEITLFSVWHILWILLIVGLSIGGAFLLKDKPQKAKTLTLQIMAYTVIGLYIADFFIMPLSQGEINIDKLPFHICTLTGVFVPFAQFNKRFQPIRNVITCYAIVGPLMYITYPGSALGGISPFSYKVIQTFLYHGTLFSWGFLSVALKAVNFNFKEIWKEAVGLVILTAWAFFGNYAYVGIPEGHHYDWFFVTGSTFPFVPEWLMHFLVFAAVFGMCALIYAIDLCVKKIIEKRAAESQPAE